MSQDPTDRLIRDLIRAARLAIGEEIARIIERLATAPFSERLVSVPPPLRAAYYGGRPLARRETSLIVHVVQHSVVEGQWATDTDADAYVDTLRAAVRLPAAQLVVYPRRGGPIAGILAHIEHVLTARQRGPGTLPWLYVAYSGDRGMIISGYRASSPDTLGIPPGALWLK